MMNRSLLIWLIRVGETFLEEVFQIKWLVARLLLRIVLESDINNFVTKRHICMQKFIIVIHVEKFT